LKAFFTTAKTSKQEETMFTKIISKKGFLFPVLALTGLLTVAPPVFSQTGGMERRDDRQEGRQEKRGEKQEGRSEAKEARQEGRESGDRSEGRQKAREAKQTGRQEGRDAKQGGGQEK
jgi:hypothetical protein